MRKNKILRIFSLIKGFTLVELLVVMALIGILATVSLGYFRTSQIKARDARRKSDLAQIQKALEMYYNDYGMYPEGWEVREVLGFETENPILEGCGSDGRQPCTWNGESSWVAGSGTVYMKILPQDSRYPATYGNYIYSHHWGTDYNYQRYLLWVRLENERDPDIDESKVHCGISWAGPLYIVCGGW